MRAVIFLLSFLIVTAPAVAQRQALGIFFGWGAFEEQSPRKCFAVAQPLPSSRAREQQPYASIAFWPARRISRQAHVRLSRAAREGSSVVLRIDERSFLLAARGADAWARDARADAEIAAAMRTGLLMTVESRSRNGSLMRDRYPLRGAATAIDAAAVACARG